MRSMKKILSTALILALALCLCACDSGVFRFQQKELSFEERLANAAQQMKQVKSMHLDLDLNIDLDMTVAIGEAEQSENLDMTSRYGIDIQNEPLKMYMEMEVLFQGEGGTLLSYAEQAGDEVLLYSSYDDGTTWSKTTTASVADLTPQDPVQQTALFLACAGSFTETGKETVNGSQATVYSGVISGQYVEEAIKSTGVLDSLGQMGVEASEEMFQDLGDIPASIAIDDASGMLVRYEMDMSQVMQNMMDRLIGSMLAQYGMTETSVTLTVGKVQVVMTLSRFNSVGEIVIPEAAKAA